jgi:hypothetical protein
VVVSLRFANGSQGTIGYLANGDKSFSKERIDVFGGAQSPYLRISAASNLFAMGRSKQCAPIGVRTKVIAASARL